MNRRGFLKHITKVAGIIICARPSMLAKFNESMGIIPNNIIKPPQAPSVHIPKYKKLSFYNIHTGEWFKNIDIDPVLSKGNFTLDLSQEIQRIFIDHRTHQTHAIDPKLIRLIHDILMKIDGDHPIHLVSGYRSIQSNSMLRERSSSVAQNSYHTKGKAADIYLEKIANQRVQKLALGMGCGGVGRYHDFVHIDTGRIRKWGLPV